MNKQNSFVDYSNEINIKEIFFILARNFKIIVISVFFTTLLTTFYGSLLSKTYTSSSSLLIQQEQTDISSIFSLGDRSETNFLLNEIQILQSRNIRHKTIAELYENHRDNLILFGSVRPEYSFFGTLVRDFLNVIRNEESYDIETFEKFVQTPLYSDTMINISANLSISNPRKTDVITVMYSSKSPEEAALILNTIIFAYQQADQEWAAGELIYLDKFLNEQILEKESRLVIAEDNLMEFQEDSSIFSNSEINNLLITELTKVESDYYKTIAEKNIEAKRKQFYLNQLNEGEKELAKKITTTLNIKLSSMRNNLSKLETELVSVKATKGVDHPAVNEIQSKINKLKKDLKLDTKKYIDEGISSSNPLLFRQTLMDTIISISANEEMLLATEKELGILVNEYSNRLKDLPSKILTLSRLKRDKTILDETYKVMKKTLEETRISKAAELGRVRIIDKANIPILASSLGLSSYWFLGLLLGLGVGLIIIVIREYLDNTIKSIEELERRDLPILSIIPEFESTEKNRYISLLDNPKSVVSESYRNLRTSLMMENIDDTETSQTILVCSPGPKEGKSTTSTNLALSYAQTGKKVIFIDADLRKPVIHKIFNLKKSGLTNYFADSDKDSYKKYIHRLDKENISVFTAGPVPPNPSEILSSQRLKYLISCLKKEYDVIIFDSPPFIAVTDSFILSKLVEHTVLVVKSNTTLKAILQRTLASLMQQKTRISGVVFNGIKSGTGYYGGYYYNYYSYYYGESSENKK